MTYLELVNNVLRRLREREVSSVSSTAYSKLIGMLVNDAKQEVEDSWNWSALRTTLTAVTSANTFSYILTDADNRLTMIDVINDTDNHVMEYKDSKWMNKVFLAGDPSTGSPLYYSFNGLDSNGDTIVEVYPIPDGVYNIRFNATIRPADLVNDSDEVLVPVRPIMNLAYAKAVEERGEDGGVVSSSAYMTASKALGDAISLDATKHPEELIWQEM